MKTWEMIKELTENPNKKFTYDRATKGSYATVVHGNVVWQGKEQKEQVVAISVNKDDWEEIKNPVSFMEAVKSGQPLRVDDPIVNKTHDYYDFYMDYQYINDLLWRLSNDFSHEDIRCILTDGEFYIE